MKLLITYDVEADHSLGNFQKIVGEAKALQQKVDGTVNRHQFL